MSGEGFSDSNKDLRGLKTAPASLWHQSRRRGQHDAETDTFNASLRIMPERRCNMGGHEPRGRGARVKIELKA